MKNILAIDTASAYLSLALQVDDRVYKYMDKVDNKQSENIIPQIQALILKAGIKPRDIQYIAYNQGPGSFTGLRVGLSVALGIAIGINAGLIPIPSFAIYALQAYELTHQSKVVVGLDARLNQLYMAGIDTDTFEYFIQPAVVSPQDILITSDVVLIGSGFIEYLDLFDKTIGSQNVIVENYPDATYLLKLANLEKYKPVSAAHADLLYLRNKVALNLDEQKHKISQSI